MARLGVSDVRDYQIPRCKLYFCPTADLDANGKPKNLRVLGNAPAVTVSVAAEEIEHFSSQEGLSTVDRTVYIKQVMSLGLTLEEFDLDNLALFFAGERSQLVQAGAAIDATPGGNPNLILTGKGKWYDLYSVASPSAYPPALADNAKRVYRISGVTVKSDDDVTTFTAGSDYVLDAEMGRIFIPMTSTIGATASLNVDMTPAALTIEELKAIKSATVTGVLVAVQENENDDSAAREFFWTNVTIRAEGDFPLVAEEIAQFQLAIKCAKDAAGEVCIVRDITNAA